MTVSLTAMMYVPGSDERKLAKIDQLTPNAYIIDLEDAVAVSVKDQARSVVRSYLASYKGNQQLWLRVNGIESGLMLDDISAVVSPVTAGIVVPKVESDRTIHAVEWILDEFENKSGLTQGSIAVMPLIETVAGISQLDQIITASARTVCLAFGAGDYSLDLGIEWPPQDGRMNPLVLAAKVRLVEASRTHGLLAPHDGVFPDVRDLEALAIEARASYNMGFGGKHAIHPGQIDIIRQSFAPSEKQLAWAHRVLEAFEESESRGVAAIQIEGRFIDYPVVHRARQIVAAGAIQHRKGETS